MRLPWRVVAQAQAAAGPHAGLVMFSGLLVAGFLAAGAVPANYEISPFKVEWDPGLPALPGALFRNHDPGAAFSLLFNAVTTPPRLVWAPTGTPRVAQATRLTLGALTPTNPSPTARPAVSPTPAPSPQRSATPTPYPTPGPTPSPTP